MRQSVKSCAVFYDDKCKELHKFHPLLVVNDDWMNEFIKVYGIKLCKLYYPPYTFKRTGCCGCPFNTELQKQLDTLSALLPAEKRRAEYLWKPVYSEYRKIGYRLRPLDLFDL